jgi:hypothetical protein
MWCVAVIRESPSEETTIKINHFNSEERAQEHAFNTQCDFKKEMQDRFSYVFDEKLMLEEQLLEYDFLHLYWNDPNETERGPLKLRVMRVNL